MENMAPYNYEKVYSVSEFTRILKTFVEYSFYIVRLRGEISSLKITYANAYYFDLKDEGAKIRCIIFKKDISRVKFEIKDGLSVIIYGRISIYEARGDYSVIVNEMEPFGYGELFLLFEKLKEKLEKEGLFDESRKRAIPFLPETIGIVTSKSGAVFHDMLKIIYKRFENIHVIFANASVQGEKAPQEIAKAIENLNAYGKTTKKIDVIIVGRGGGSLEDLWAFNEEITARAIYNSDIPVISAVGHEPDITIADYVADRRASTPSNAAEIVVPVKSELLREIRNLRERLNIAKAISNKRSLFISFHRRLEISTPLRMIYDRRIKIDETGYKLRKNTLGWFETLRNTITFLDKRLTLRSPNQIINQKRTLASSFLKTMDKSISIFLKNKKERVKSESLLLNSFNPYNVLKRGYGIVFSGERKVISSASAVNSGDKIKIRLKDGAIAAAVTGTEEIP